jgi:hypothetical protein
MSHEIDPEDTLPLTPLTYHVLLARIHCGSRSSFAPERIVWKNHDRRGPIADPMELQEQ